jgi:hypothetical protein
MCYYLALGFDVFWKGHPRTGNFDVRVKQVFGDRVSIIESNLIPLELFIYLYPEIELCGISSSALLYNAFLLSGKAKQAVDLVIDHANKNCIWYEDFMAMFDIVNKNVPKLQII